MQKGILAILAVYVPVLLSGCDTLYPLRPLPHLEVFAQSSQVSYYCTSPLIWKIREAEKGQFEAICGLIDGRYAFYGYGTRDGELKILPHLKEVSQALQVLCRSPADWEVRYYPKDSNNIAAVCGLPISRYNNIWWGWGWWGGYPGWGYYRYPMW